MRIVSLLSAALISCISLTASAQEATLRLVSAFPENTVYVRQLQEWLNKVNAENKGVLQIRFIGGPKAIPTFEVGNSLKTGVVDLALSSGSYFINLVPEGNALNFAEIPASEQRKRGAYEYINKVFGNANISYLARMVERSPFHMYLNKKVSNADLSNLKIRTSPLYRDLLQQLGATPVQTAPGEVYVALERGVVDGYGWNIHGIFDLNWAEKTKYRLDPGFYNAEVSIWANRDALNKLTPAQRAALDKAALTLESMAGFWDAYNDSERKRQADAGIEIIRLDDAAAIKFVEQATNAGWEGINKVSPQHGPELRKLLTK